ncbi:pentatricopeptide repeat-containing protein At1g11290, chloroplastic-like [Humulus lupulus]|uniref:pentatricopeptide repeat-containing protein At1g11290, chloroplastic-like n=1 Tax=Humulus lupulus TaxID=3486 RepID=UPI002B40A60E|nr:pentatricopeptide repeat-containing protein At1g11290, chloroplastic-like [Humulus lupulus]
MLSSQRSRCLISDIFILKIPCFPWNQTRFFSTFSSLLNLCTKPQQLKQIHARFILHGLQQNSTLSSKLIDCYAELGLLNLSHLVFNSITDPSSVFYNAMLRNLAKFGDFDKTILFYQEMVRESMYLDEETYPFVLRSCNGFGVGWNWKMIHGHVVKLGFDSFGLVVSGLEELYGQSGDLLNKTELVDGNSVSRLDFWNFHISEASQSGNGEESFHHYKRMRMEKIEPSSVTLINLLRSSVDLKSVRVGKSVHCLVLVSNLGIDLSVNTALLSMYAKLGALKDAKLLFEKMPEKDCVVWNILISANSRNSCPKEAIKLLRGMGRSGIRADLFTALPVISSITRLKSIEWGKQMHAHVIRNGLDYQVPVHNSLIDMYCECDKLNSARKIFELLENKTLVSWSTMIKGCVTHDQSLDALSLFSNMKLNGFKADFITIINILPACVNIGALENVKYFHGYSMKSGLSSLSSLNTALLVSYAKCGCIEMAQKVFDEEKINNKDVITWNSMISAYSKHGDWQQCFELYQNMKQSNMKPDQVTFLGLLTACVNSGLVKEGKNTFKEMMESYGCQPNQEHYACMVDLLGRAGHINEAKELVKSMPFEPDARVWGPLLSACKMKHSETDLAEFAAEKLITMEPKNAGNYILLSNIYAAAGKWDGVAKMRSVLRDKGLKKTPGCSWLEINGKVHEFRVADRSHPRSEDIYTILRNLELEFKDAKDNNSENRL